TLPNSGYVFRFTKEMGLTSDGTCNFEHKTVPDIKVSAKIGVNFNEDEAIQTVLKLLK
ncbi:MAG TPA: peptidase S41, partial [Clostridium sp.]|nr:peptidase S41 [Clostridium sp.]